MSCETETAQVLREAGQKTTPQRLMILSALRHADGHLTANDIFEQVRMEYPYVDISTVYRTLDTLQEMRLVSSVDEGVGRAAYQWLDSAQPHHHLVCKGCGAEAALDGEIFDRLSAAVREETGFEPFLDHFVISGLCRDCAETPSPVESARGLEAAGR